MIRSEHREEGWAFPFVSYSPKNAAGKLPLIIQLHGAGERGQGKEDLALVDIHGFSKLITRQDIPCLFILPQCPLDTFWVARIESILTFIDQLFDYYNIDTSRVYLTGLSMGGFGTWYTAMAKPELFAAIAPICGGGMPWYAFVLDMPVWAFHGNQDPVVDPINSDQMVERLQSIGHDVTYSRLKDVGHNAWEYAYQQELLQWLLSKKRTKEDA